jgi:hypothetical protein
MNHPGKWMESYYSADLYTYPLLCVFWGAIAIYNTDSRSDQPLKVFI